MRRSATTPSATPTSPEPTSSRGRRTARLGTIVLVGTVIALGGAGVAAASPAPATGIATTAGASTWGAIAVDPDTGNTGYVWDYPDADAASRAAVGQCGSGNCQTVVQVTNGCASVAQASDLSWGWGYGVDRTSADDAAVAYTPGAHAHVLGWVCSGYYR